MSKKNKVTKKIILRNAYTYLKVRSFFKLKKRIFLELYGVFKRNVETYMPLVKLVINTK